jgi:hypothetical protein
LYVTVTASSAWMHSWPVEPLTPGGRRNWRRNSVVVPSRAVPLALSLLIHSVFGIVAHPGSAATTAASAQVTPPSVLTSLKSSTASRPSPLYTRT